MSKPTSRRRFLVNSLGAGVAAGASRIALMSAAGVAPALVRAESAVIKTPYGVQSGDLTRGGGVLWSRADRPGRLLVEWADNPEFVRSQWVRGPAALEDTDFCAKLDLQGLPAGQRVYYRAQFQDLRNHKSLSEPVSGSMLTGGYHKRPIRFVWSGDTAGQGFGINPDFGGMKIYRTMLEQRPDFFIHSGDTVYADGPIAAEREHGDGQVWRNLVTEEVSKVAESLHEFRGRFAYNLMDDNLRAFNAQVPMFAQWDDHEVVNNWYPTEILNDDRYTEKNVDLLAARGARAFMEYMPVRQHPAERDRLYSHFKISPSMEVFRIDMRSYRGSNGPNNQAEASAQTRLLGAEQMRWLKQALANSTATWKIIASDMPIGMIVYDNWREKNTFENGANGDGPALGRELEIAELLRSIRDNGVENVVWFTADVHYTAAHHYDPSRAQFQEFSPFWEFVSGPLNAGTFGPNDMDNTFGPQVVYAKAPEGGRVNLAPSEGLQFFGQVDLDAETEMLTVQLKDLDGTSLFTQVLTPAGRA